MNNIFPKPSFKEAFWQDLNPLFNEMREEGTLSEETASMAIINYALDMVQHFTNEMDGFLPDDWKEHTINEVISAVDEHYPLSMRHKEYCWQKINEIVSQGGNNINNIFYDENFY